MVNYSKNVIKGNYWPHQCHRVNSTRLNTLALLVFYGPAPAAYNATASDNANLTTIKGNNEKQ